MWTDFNWIFDAQWNNTVNPLLSPPPQSIWGGKSLLEGEGLLNLGETMVSALHKELENKVEKLNYKKIGGHAGEDQNQIRTSNS